MSAKQILPGLYQITTMGIHVYLIDSGELILVDVGPPNNAKAIQNVYEDFEEVKGSLAKIAALDFDTACFCHGKTIVHGASDMFKQKWGTI